jgi:hypothetical protein
MFVATPGDLYEGSVTLDAGDGWRGDRATSATTATAAAAINTTVINTNAHHGGRRPG